MTDNFKLKYHLSPLNFFIILFFFCIFSLSVFNPVQGQDNLQYTGKSLWSDPTISGQNSISISNDGTYTAAVGIEGLTLIDKSGTRVWTRNPLERYGTIWSAAIADEGRYIIIGSSDKNAYYFDKSGNLLWKYQTGIIGIPGREVAGVGISRDGRSIAIGEGDGTIKLLNEKGSLLWSYSLNERLALSGVAISDDGNYIAALTEFYNNVYLFDKTGKLLWKNHYTEYQGFFMGHGVAISKDGRYIIVGCTNENVYCFDSKGSLLWKTDLGADIGPVAISDDGLFIVAGSENKNIFLLDNNGKILWYYPTLTTVEGVSISGDGSLIAGSIKDHEAFVITNPNFDPQALSPQDTVAPVVKLQNAGPNNPNPSNSNGIIAISFVLAIIFVGLIVAFSISNKRNQERRNAEIQNHEKTPIDKSERNGIWYGSVKESPESKQMPKKPENIAVPPKSEHASAHKTPYTYSPIPEDLFERACGIIVARYGFFPIECRGIRIRKNLVKATMEILNSAPEKKLPQNCRNDIRENTPDGLDLRIKEYLNSDLRNANIFTDILESVGIASNVQILNDETKRLIKGSQLNQSWCWEPQNIGNVPFNTPNVSEIKDEIRTYRNSLERNPDDPGTWRTYDEALSKLYTLDFDEYQREKRNREILKNYQTVLPYDRIENSYGTVRKRTIISEDEVYSYLENNRDFDEYD